MINLLFRSAACLIILVIANQAKAASTCIVTEPNGPVTISGPLEVVVHVNDSTGKNAVFGSTPKFSVKVQPMCGSKKADGTSGVKDWGYTYGSAGTGKRADGTTYAFDNRPIFTDAEYTSACVNVGKGAVNGTATKPINWSWFVNPSALLYSSAKNSGSTGKSVKILCQRQGCDGVWK